MSDTEKLNKNFSESQTKEKTPDLEFQDHKTMPSEVPEKEGRFLEFLRRGLQPSGELLRAVLPNTVALLLEQKKLFQYPYILHPYSYVRIVWELFIIVLSIVTVVEVPLSVAFNDDNIYTYWTLFSNVIFDAIFVVDVIVNFRTGYEHLVEFTIVMEGKSIAWHYFRRWFIFDLLSSLPIDVIYHSLFRTGLHVNVSKFLSMLRLLRIIRLCRYVQKLERFLEFRSIYLRFLNLLVLIFLITHWVACLQFLIVDIQNFPNGSWVDLSHIQHSSVGVQYTHSMFKSLSQFISVGYGAITPIETTDIIITMFTCAVGSFVYATFIGFLSDIILSRNSRHREFSHKLAGVCDFLKYKNVPRALQNKIIKYYKRCYPSHFFNEVEILAELSPALRKELLLVTYRPLIKTVPFLANLKTSILYEIVQLLHHEVFLPGDVIQEEGVDSIGIFFLYRGMVDIQDKARRMINRMSNGFYFGDISILNNKPNVANMVAYEISEVYMLARADFLAVVQRHPDSFRDMYEHAKTREQELTRKVSTSSGWSDDSEEGKQQWQDT